MSSAYIYYFGVDKRKSKVHAVHSRCRKLSRAKHEPMPMTADELKDLHNHYCQLSGLPVPYTFYHEYSWGVWEHYGFTKPDIELVIRYVQKRIKGQHRQKESLMFRNLIAHPESFADDLAMARSLLRKPVVDEGKQSVLRATHRPVEVDVPARSAADILAGEKAFAAFQAMKAEL